MSGLAAIGATHRLSGAACGRLLASNSFVVKDACFSPFLPDAANDLRLTPLPRCRPCAASRFNTIRHWPAWTVAAAVM